MSSAAEKPSSFRRTFATVAAVPGLLWCMQIPEASLEFIEMLLPRSIESTPVLSFGILVTYYWLASLFSTALTFSVVLRRKNNQPCTSRTALEDLFRNLKPLMLASLLAGLIILLATPLLIPPLALGMLLNHHFSLSLPSMVRIPIAAIAAFPLTFPAAYVITLYSFVPQIVLCEPTVPAAVSLVRSKRFAKSRITKSMGIYYFSLVLSGVSYFGGESIVSSFHTSQSPSPQSFALATGLRFLIASVCSLFANTLLSEYFLKHRESAV